MDKWTLITASAIFATQNTKLNPCTPCSFKSECFGIQQKPKGMADAMIEA